MPTQWKRAFTVALALVGVAVTVRAVPRAVGAEVDPETKKHFDLANKLYQEQRYDDALVEYDTAYELSKNWKILYNRAQCLVLLKREPEAINSFERYLAEGGNEIPSARRESVKADIADLKNRLGRVAVEGAPPGAKIRLDKVYIGTTPMAPFEVGSGTHDLEVTPAAGGTPFKSNIKVTAGNVTAIRVDFGTPAVVDPPVVQPPTGGGTGPDLPPPPPMPVLPSLPPGGLVAPAFQVSLAASGLFGNDHPYISQKAMGGAELSVSYRTSPFWEFGLFFLGATGSATVDARVRSASGGTDLDGGFANVDPEASQRHLFGGVRARMHLVRTKRFDGWLGIDFGGWSESWTFQGKDAFTYKSSSPAFGLGVGVDVPLSAQWALGLGARWFAASASNGRREECGSGSTTGLCNSSYALVGEVGRGLSSRSFAEVGIRLVFSLPAGPSTPAPPKADPGAPTAAAISPSVGP